MRSADSECRIRRVAPNPPADDDPDLSSFGARTRTRLKGQVGWMRPVARPSASTELRVGPVA